ncbi:MAG: fasciclin domain-containing protein [Allosphingosinicella sp.]
MSHRFKILALAAAALCVVPAAASPSGPRGNLVAAAASSDQHQTLVAAVRAAGLVDTLASGGPFTVFAPTDAAFAKLPQGAVAMLLQEANRDRLRAVLTYHVVPGAVTSTQLVNSIRQNGGQVTLTTVQGGTLTARLSDGRVALTDAAGGTSFVTQADLVQSNGVIHVTDAVSLPM